MTFADQDVEQVRHRWSAHSFKRAAEAIGRQIGVPARSLTPDEAQSRFGGLATWVTGHGPAFREITRAVLGWAPVERDPTSNDDRLETLASSRH